MPGDSNAAGSGCGEHYLSGLLGAVGCSMRALLISPDVWEFGEGKCREELEETEAIWVTTGGSSLRTVCRQPWDNANTVLHVSISYCTIPYPIPFFYQVHSSCQQGCHDGSSHSYMLY